MGVLTMIAQLILSLSILVVLHELGHFLPAKWFKTRVEKFYLFFDPWFSLVKKKVGDTEYGIGWLPLGGYVKISGMIDESMDTEQMQQPPKPWEFRSKPAWQRLIIMLGGVTVNFLLGFLIFGMILFAYGEQYLPSRNVTYGIAVDSIGYELGLRDGDQILRLDGEPFDRFEPSEITRAIVLKDLKNIEVMRDGREVQVPVDPRYVGMLSSSKYAGTRLATPRMPFVIAELGSEEAERSGLQEGDRIVSLDGRETLFYHEVMASLAEIDHQRVEIGVVRGESEKPVVIPHSLTAEGKIGVFPYPPAHFFDVDRQDYSMAQAIPAGFTEGWSFLTDQFKAFGKMFKGDIKASDSLGGFGTITKLFPERWDWESFWRVTAILSLILGFMNLLPIPALDGGHVMFLIYEVISGRKPSDKFMEYATMAGFAIVLGLVIYANGLDVWRWLQG